MQHVATWKEGDEKWAYHEDAFAHISTHKVSLDPYRMESRKILACIKDVLKPPPLQRVEKASVDEVFLDLSAQIHSVMLERYPEISGPAPYDDPTELLPRPPTTALDWDTDALIDLDNTENEDDDPDWDDIAMLIGSEIVRSVRAAIRERLHYTSSAGIACNKMIAKLGSGHKKPNQQTIVRNRAIQQFLGSFKFTKIRNLGGKLGEDVVAKFGTDQVKELLEVSLGQTKLRLGDDTGSWVYGVIRGEDYSEVNSRTQIKSMLSAKSFRPTINSFEQAEKWLRIFVADIFSRLVEEGVLENKRRPKTINLHHRQGGQMRSRQAPIPSGRHIDEALLFDVAKNLLSQVVVDGRAWPCSNLQLSVAGFEEGLIGNRGIGGFLLRGEEAKAIKHTLQDTEDLDLPDQAITQGHTKRHKLENRAIVNFLSRQDTRQDEHEKDVTTNDRNNGGVVRRSSSDEDMKAPQGVFGADVDFSNGDKIKPTPLHSDAARSQINSTKTHTNEACPNQALADTFSCATCKGRIPLAARGEHEDWHLARTLQEQERTASDGALPAAGRSNPSALGSGKSKSLKETHGHPLKRTEKGQSRLAFG